MQKKKILFLISDTGGGHRAAASAVAAALKDQAPGRLEIVIEDVWQDHTPWPYNRLPKLYPWLAGGSGMWLWRLGWEVTMRVPIHSLFLFFATWFTKQQLARYFDKVQPDLIVSVHPFLNHIGIAGVRHAGITCPVVTIVTDMIDVHPLWICGKMQRYYVSTEQAYAQAVTLGADPQRVEVHGQPIGLQFEPELRPSRQALLAQLDFVQNKPIILLIGGGDGLGRLYPIAREIATSLSMVQLIVIAGRNQTLYDRLTDSEWEVPTRVFGFVENVAPLMQVADILITKAGPGSLNEAFSVGLPILMFSHVPGQEIANVKFVEARRAGTYQSDLRQIVSTLCQWIATPSLRQAIAAESAALARPYAARNIARSILHHFIIE